jgi:hypothetical protein
MTEDKLRPRHAKFDANVEEFALPSSQTRRSYPFIFWLQARR